MSHYASETFLHQLLGKAIAAGATDVHLKVGKPPGARVGRDLVFFRVDEIRPDDTEAAARLLLGSDARVEEEVQRAYEAPAVGRFRVSAFRQQSAISLVLRRVPTQIPDAAAIGLPATAIALIERPHGLVVLAGGPSSGRSTTAAALLAHVSDKRACHVVTFEDPIEHVYADDRQGSVAQRALGHDVESLAVGLRGAARHDADVLFASDLRTAEELDAALDASARALVLAVIGAPDVRAAIAKLAAWSGTIPDGAGRLVTALEGVVAQRLLPAREGAGAALELRYLTAKDLLARAIQGSSEVASDLAALSFEAG